MSFLRVAALGVGLVAILAACGPKPESTSDYTIIQSTISATPAHVAKPAPTPPQYLPMEVNAEIVELFKLVNDYRIQNGLSPLEASVSLTEAAEWMANNMSSNNYVEHVDLEGRKPSDRMRDFGYNYNTTTGENLAGGQTDALTVFNVWKNSPGHNMTMLHPDFKVAGFAVAYNPNSDYGYFLVQDFGVYQDGLARYISTNSTFEPTPTPFPIEVIINGILQK